MVGLLPAKRGAHGPRTITPEVMGFIEEGAADGRDSDLTRLVGEIAQRFRLVVHPRTVARALARFMSPPELGRDGRNLAACYEALREHVLGLAVCRHTVHGLALLMREGMAAWMESVAQEPMHDAAIPTARERV